MKLNLGSIVPISTIDWYGKAAMVIFLRGCPLRCPYCQNYHLLDSENLIEIEEVEAQIEKGKKYVSAVVFSGGEPTMQIEALECLAMYAKQRGLLVGVETSGYYPDRIRTLINKKLVDRIFLDIKAPLEDPDEYTRIVGGNREAAERAAYSLKEASKIQLEIRTTLFRSIEPRIIEKIAQELKGYECTYAIQQGRSENVRDSGIKKEKPLSREELKVIAAKAKPYLKDIRIRTKEAGEERIT